jgi:ketol-acid reductoisomerase
MKTAMQELIDEMNLIKNLLWEEGLKDKSAMISDMIKKAVNKLEKEKELACQFAQEYINGASYDTLRDYYDEKFEQYYNQTYNQNKSFTYCQREIEGQSICDKQCEHCKEYYAPLENQNK